MSEGQLCLVLHAHLPFVRHPDFDRWLEEDWLFEAIIETYLPLLRSYARLVDQHVPFRVTMTMSPTLMAMLSDDVMQKRFVRHIDRLIELSEKEVERTRWIPEFLPLAERYLELFRLSRREFVEIHDWNLVRSFRKFQDAGVLELITCGATHGFLPLMLRNRDLWRGQILTAADDHERHFGRRPRGIWLPECGFESGVEEILAEAGIEYFFTDTHGILHATPRPQFGVYAPLRTPSGVCAFGRDQQSSRQVWSAEVGYPGDADYREFYRDVGWDLDYEYVKPYLHSDGNRTPLGIKYYRITRQDDHKEPYDFVKAQEKSARHAEDFLNRRAEQAKTLRSQFGRKPFIVSPYDAELFGHWWFEGPQFLEYLFLKTHYDQDVVDLATPGDYIDQNPRIQPAMPSMSSWGHNGFSEYWLDPSNDWLYPLVQWAGEQMVELARDYPDAVRGTVPYRALSQAARELVLAQSSDWAFILRTGSMVEYAKWRAESHLKNFDRLAEEIRLDAIDEEFLADLELKDNVFPEVDYKVWATEAESRADHSTEDVVPGPGDRSDSDVDKGSDSDLDSDQATDTDAPKTPVSTPGVGPSSVS